MSPFDGRFAALGRAMRGILAQPLRFCLLVVAAAWVLAALTLAGLAAWRTLPLRAPQWLRPEALVLVAGAEGEVDLGALRTTLHQVPGVEAVEFIGRDAALRELARRPNLSGIGLAELRPNPLPDAFLVRFAPGTAPEAVEASVAAIRKIHSIESAEYEPELVRRSAILLRLGARLGWLMGAFAGAALLLALLLAAGSWARVDAEEARVLHLLGVPQSAIVRPYAYAGGGCLLLAGLLAWWAVSALAGWLEPDYAAIAGAAGLAWEPDPLPPWGAPSACLVLAWLGTLFSGLVARWQLRRVPPPA